jgi:hypothetical protein
MDSDRFCPFDENGSIEIAVAPRQEFHSRSKPYHIGISCSYFRQVLLSLKLFNLDTTQILKPFFSTFVIVLVFLISKLQILEMDSIFISSGGEGIVNPR